MTDADIMFFKIFGGAVAVLIVVELVRRFIKARPCWFFNHQMKHLSIDLRIWPKGICHRCNEALSQGSYSEDFRHYPHKEACYVTKWICDKQGCGEMGLFCVGEKKDGAWTIQHGKIVPDEKEWSRW